jgi:hypothetical protein
LLLGEVPYTLRKAKLIEGRDFIRDRAERERDVTALPEGVDAEARQTRALIGRVELAGLVEAGKPGRSGGADLFENELKLGWPIFRWTSLAPRSTPVRSRLFRSMATSSAGPRAWFRGSSRIVSTQPPSNCSGGSSSAGGGGWPGEDDGANGIGGNVRFSDCEADTAPKTLIIGP